MANGAFCGGGFHSNPNASLIDGQIDLLTINNVGRIRFVSLVGKYKKGEHICQKLAHIIGNRKCSTVDLYFDRETPVSIDGEIVFEKELHLSVDRGALRFMLPKGITPRMMPEAETAQYSVL
jgi:diacylglycerol kinase family enzyme